MSATPALALTKVGSPQQCGLRVERVLRLDDERLGDPLARERHVETPAQRLGVCDAGLLKVKLSADSVETPAQGLGVCDWAS